MGYSIPVPGGGNSIAGYYLKFGPDGDDLILDQSFKSLPAGGLVFDKHYGSDAHGNLNLYSNPSHDGKIYLGANAYFDETNDKFFLATLQTIYIPDQTDFRGTFIIGTGGASLSHTGGEEGRSNTFIGHDAGLNNTTGTDNSFVGFSVGYSNTIGNGNIAFGSGTLFSNVSGNGNSAFGIDAGYFSTGDYNTFFGQQAGFGNTTGDNNCIFGPDAGKANAGGNNNVFFGFQAGFNNTASDNVFIGYQAGLANITGTLNTMIGDSAGRSNQTSNFNCCVGYAAGQNITGAQNTMLGSLAGGVTTGQGNIIIGFNVAASVGGAMGEINIGNAIKCTVGTQVIGNRVIDARIANVPNSGDADTDALIDCLRDWAIAWGAIAAA